MQKFSFLLLLFSLTIFARENPFFPVSSTQDIEVTTNQLDSITPLDQVSIELPSTARVLESISVTYKNLDGSLVTKKLKVKRSIDWHLPLFISQNYQQNAKQKAVHKELKNFRYKKVGSLPFVKFYANAKNLKIITKDKLLRDFLLVKPHRIVCDFKRDIDIRSYVKKLPKSMAFKTIKVGTHKGYYRVVIELDGYYVYKVKKQKNGYLFSLL